MFSTTLQHDSALLSHHQVIHCTASIIELHKFTFIITMNGCTVCTVIMDNHKIVLIIIYIEKRDKSKNIKWFKIG
jgi:hypothetical protein